MRCKKEALCGITCTMDSSICKKDFCPEYIDTPRTNADRIRAMSDEELACFLSDMAETCERNTECNQSCYGCNEMFCELDDCLKWLTQPAKEE